MAEDKMYFLLTSQSGTGEVTFFSGSPTMANLQMQAQCHPAVLPSQNVSLPTAQKGERKHGDLPLILYYLEPEVIALWPKATSVEAGRCRQKHVIFSEQYNLCHARFIHFS